ncbi:MAG: hypothetical protein AAF086_06210 [Planctomycetota bacterium]
MLRDLDSLLFSPDACKLQAGQHAAEVASHLRHKPATRVQRAYSEQGEHPEVVLNRVRVTLGHSDSSTARVDGERDRSESRRVIKTVG